MPDKLRKLRIGSSDKRPGSFQGLLTVMPRHQPLSFTATRRFPDGSTLPSFKAMGASYVWPGQVAYPSAVYDRLHAKWKLR